MHVCITGGSSGLGEALARVFLLKEWKVSVIDRKRNTSLSCSFIHHDFSYSFSRAVECDLLVLNHATFDGFVSFSSTSEEYIDSYLSINLISHLHLLKHIRFKRLIYINSVLSCAAFPGAALYSSCKSFMHSFLSSLRREGLPVLSVYPYKIDTQLFSSVRSPYVLSKEEVALSIYSAYLSNRSTLYAPAVFRLSFLLGLLPLFVQDLLISFISYLLVRERIR